MTAALLLLVADAPRFCRAANADSELLQAMEVIRVLKSNYVDRDKIDDKLLNEATVAGILQALGRGVEIIVPEPPATNATGSAPIELQSSGPLARAEVIDLNIGYIRLADVTDKTTAAFDAELKTLDDAHVTGYVLDLRFADGVDYAAAAAVASRFLSGGQELFTLKSSEKDPQIFRASKEAQPVAADKSVAAEVSNLSSAPLILLVNAKTRGSAEALAGALRAQDHGIVIGAKTAGAPADWKDVKLSDGRILRLATAKIVLPAKADGTGSTTDLFPDGIKPDVAVKVDPKIERDAVFAMQTNETLTATLQPRSQKKGLTEAELVKAFRGQGIDMDKPSINKEREGETDVQTVRDAALQRAVDILKSVRVLLSRQ